MPNVVVDASTIASAALKRDSVPERALLLAVIYDVLHLSEPVLAEIRDVLARPKFEKYLTAERISEVLALLLADARLLVPTQHVHECRDPADDKYLELALAAGAHAVVTGDDDLLSMSPWRGIVLMNAAAYVALISAREHLAAPPRWPGRRP